MQYFRSPPRVKRNISSLGAYTNAGKRAKIQAYARRARRALSRGAIGARTHLFKRMTETFGFISGVNGVSTIELINANQATAEFLLKTGTPSSSQFQNGAYQFGGSLQFMLAHVANVSEITNLFDNYRIAGVVVKVVPGFNSADVSQIGLNIPIMHYSVDTDDSSVPTSRISLLENSLAKTVRLDKPFSIYIKPRAQNVVATTSGTASAGMLPASQWLDCASTTIPHFGLKFWIDEFPTVPSATSARAMVKFSVSYMLEAKNVL